jgi:hypothetical protein
MRKIVLFLLGYILIGCQISPSNLERLEKSAWDNLYVLKIEEAYPEFMRLVEVKKTDKNILGLAYTQAILGKGNYYSK